MVSNIPLPPDASDEAVAIWHEIAESLTAGDIALLHDAIKDYITLSPTDKQSLEELAEGLPIPGLPPMLITQIFANAEATVGVIERLGPKATKGEIAAALGTTEQAIVLDALITWLKSNPKVAQAVNPDAKVVGGSSGVSNPLNQALASYISQEGNLNAPLNLSSLQFLKNNAITLAGLKIADPELLNKAYQVASGQLLITLLPDINTSNLDERGPEQERSKIIQKQLVDEIKKALQDGAIPLNMQTYLVLWTAITLTNSVTEVTEKRDQPVANRLPESPVIASLLAALPEVGTATDSKELPEMLGMLSYIYTQMAPYWSGPAAVSLLNLQTTSEPQTREEKKLESAVRAFAISFGALLNDPTFDKLLTILIKRQMPTVSEEQLKVFIAAMKISVLTNALVALYITLLRKTQGQFRADELAELILGPPIDERTDLDELLKGLVKSIQSELRFIPPERRARFVSLLLSTYSGDMDVDALVDPTKQFLNLVSTDILPDQRI